MDAKTTFERRTIDDLIHRDHYSPEELSELLSVDVYRVRSAARRGMLAAFLVDHRVVDIRREDVIAWLTREQMH